MWELVVFEDLIDVSCLLGAESKDSYSTLFFCVTILFRFIRYCVVPVSWLCTVSLERKPDRFGLNE